MSMSTRVFGFRPPDAKWKKMKAIYDACTAAKVPVPEEVEKFFDNEPPNIRGVTLDLEDFPCCKEWTDDHASGFEIHLDKLPKDVTIILFYNSW